MTDLAQLIAKPCTSFRLGELVCADGFPQKALCSGDAGCHACGHIGDAAIPLCLTEDAPLHLITEAGGPALYCALQAQQETSEDE